MKTIDKAVTYAVFVRDWWKLNRDWPNGLEPADCPKTYLGHGLTWAEARKLCQDYNSSHDPGPLSRKAEFSEE